MTAPRAEAAALAGVVLAAAALFSRGLDSGGNYDEGVYLASADALARGGDLATDVFASQPPGFYALLRLAVALPGDSIEATRVPFLLIAIAGVLAAWWLGRRLAGASAGIGAAALLTIAPGYAAESTRIAADVPSVVLAVTGLALLVHAVDRGERMALASAGAVLAAALSVKLLAATVVIPAAVVLVAARPPRRALAAFAAGALAVPLALAAVHADALGALWDDAVAFHTDARDGGLNFERVARGFDPHAPWGPIALAGVVVWAARRATPRRLAVAFAWAAAAAAFLLWQRPLLDHHFALLAVALSVPAGSVLGAAAARTRAAPAAATIVALALAAGYLQQWRAVERLRPPEPAVAAAAEAVRASTAAGELVATDLPIVAVLADRDVPGELVDTSAVRFESGSLEPRTVIDVVDAEGVRLVVAGRMFREQPSLLAALRTRFPVRREIGEITLYERSRAAARAAQAAARG